MAGTRKVAAPKPTPEANLPLPTGGGDSWPKTFKAVSNVHSSLAFPAIGLFLEGHGSSEVTFQDESAFVRFKSDVSQLAELNGWTDPVALEAIEA